MRPFINRIASILTTGAVLAQAAVVLAQPPTAHVQDEFLQTPIPPRCAARYPEKAREIRDKVHEARINRESIEKDLAQVATLQREAAAHTKTAQRFDEDARKALEQKDSVTAADNKKEADINRNYANDRLIEAQQYQRRVDSGTNTLTHQKREIDRLARALLVQCGILKGDQGGAAGGGNPVGGNQGGNQGANTGGNTADAGSGSGSGGANKTGNSGGNVPGGVTTATKPNASSAKRTPVNKTPYGSPTEVVFPDGIKQVLIKNEQGQVFRKQIFDKSGKPAGVYTVDEIYPNGNPAKDSSFSYGYPNRDKHKEIYRSVQYDANGNVIGSVEDTDRWDGTKERKDTTFKDGKPVEMTVVEKDKNGKIVKRETKVLDENGNWVTKEDKSAKSETPKPNTPKPVPAKPGPVQPPKPNDGVKVNQTGLRCLAGTWRGIEYTVADGKTGGRGIVLTIKANGETTTDVSNMTEITDGKNTRKHTGIGTAIITVENDVIKVVREVSSSIEFQTSGPAGQGRGKLKGLGPLVDPFGTPAKYFCNGNELTFKTVPGVESYKFVRVR